MGSRVRSKKFLRTRCLIVASRIGLGISEPFHNHLPALPNTKMPEHSEEHSGRFLHFAALTQESRNIEIFLLEIRDHGVAHRVHRDDLSG